MQEESSKNLAAGEIYRQLRRMAASDPRAAREKLVHLLNIDSPSLGRLLDLMSPPSEGRLRQMVANTVRALREDRQLRDRLVPHLLQWQRFESDEFAKAAINAALQGLNLAAYADDSHSLGTHAVKETRGVPIFSEEAIEIYRWVAGRLCHRVRNHLELPAAYLSDAIHCAASIDDGTIRARITQSLIESQQAFRQVARVVEFNVDDDHFRWRPVALIPWLRRMTDRYRARHGQIRLEFAGSVGEPGPGILGADLLLEVAFWNLWSNAAQEVDGECVVTIEVSIRNSNVYLLLVDNGPGFQSRQAEEAFHVSISTRGEDRGRGLLEVAEAVQRLQGAACIVPIDGKYRIELSFPLVKAPEDIA